MRFVNADAVRQALPWAALEGALEAMFRLGCEAPLRHVHALPGTGSQAGTLLLMPAWSSPGAPPRCPG